jgi:hypothetical protein
MIESKRNYVFESAQTTERAETLLSELATEQGWRYRRTALPFQAEISTQTPHRVIASVALPYESQLVDCSHIEVDMNYREGRKLARLLRKLVP